MMPPNRATRGWGWLALISIIVIGMVIPIERAEAHRIDINFSRPFEVSAEGSLSQISESVPITNRSNIVQTDSPHLEFFEFLSAQNSAIGYRASSGQSGFYFSKPEVINRMVGVVIGRPLGEMIPRKQNQRSKVYEINEGVSTSNVHNIQGDSERLIPNVVSGGLPVWRSKPDMFESKFWSVRRKKFIAGKSELVFSRFEQSPGGYLESYGCEPQTNRGDSKDNSEGCNNDFIVIASLEEFGASAAENKHSSKESGAVFMAIIGGGLLIVFVLYLHQTGAGP